MKRKRWYRYLIAGLLFVFFTAPEAIGQIAGFKPLIKIKQRWTPPLASHSSRVVVCEIPTPLGPVAMDDWVCPQTGPIIRIVWWGVLFDPGQRNRHFYIAIYSNTAGACQPLELLYSACVKPRAKVVGHDCFGNKVWRFTAKLPVPFQQTEGIQYWLQISEDDERSIRPNVEDFQWSAHRQINGCRALQRNAAGAITTPLLDACDSKPDDLAFALFSRTIIGTIPTPGIVIPTIFRLELKDPTTGDVVASQTIEPDTVDSFFDVFFEVSDGTYDYCIVGMGIRTLTGQLTLAEGFETEIVALSLSMGDLTGDGNTNVIDLLLLLAGWGSTP